jgi:AAA family ATP:ADP antiporter
MILKKKLYLLYIFLKKNLMNFINKIKNSVNSFLQEEEKSNFLFLLSLYICITYNHDMLHGLKDILILNYTKKAEFLPFIKTYLVPPFMILTIFLYMKLAKKFNSYKRFIIVLFYFLFVTNLFFFLIPNIENLKLNFFAEYLSKKFPSMKYLWEAIRFWPFSLLYMHGEAWSAIVLSVSFWGLANEISSFKTAIKTYSYLPSIGSSIGGISAGFSLKSNFIKKNYRNGLILVCFSILILISILFKNKKNIKNNFTKENSSYKIGFIDSIKTIYKSSHLRLIFFLVLSYNIFMHLFEVAWKSKVNSYSKIIGENYFGEIFGNQSILIGIFVFIIGIFSPIIKKKGWKFTASFTPFIGFISTFIFYIVSYKEFSFMKNSIGINLIYFSIIAGMINIVFIKSSKYVLFESTKEQAYIPLENFEKTSGKAAIDGIGSRFAKSIAGFILSAPYFGLIPIFGSIENSKNIIAFIVFFILIFWFFVIKKLNSSIKNYLESKT